MERRLSDPASLAIFLLIALPALAGVGERLDDPDLWWHLAAGEWILENGRVPYVDPFSRAEGTGPWIAYSWLVEIGFRRLADTLGYGVLGVWKAIVASALAGALYGAARSTGAGSRASLVAAALGTLATHGGWEERPQLASFLLLALLSWAIRARHVRRFLPVVAGLLLALWANVHILFFLGVGLLGLAAVAARLEGEPSRPLELATVVGGLATLANPYGWHLWEHVVVMLRQPQVVRAISEFQAPDLASSIGMSLGALLFTVLSVLALRPSRLTLYELGSLLGPLALALYMQKNVPLFAVLATPTLARLLSPVLEEPPPAGPSRRRARLHGAAIAAVIAGTLLQVPRQTGWRERIEPLLFPIEAADLVAAEYPAARLFNHFNWGGFLIFRLGSRTPVWIDGRTQVYGERLLGSYLRIATGGTGWREELDATGAGLVLWPRRGALPELLELDPAWRLVHEDRTAVLYERVTGSR